jgi:hypothetical protein
MMQSVVKEKSQIVTILSFLLLLHVLAAQAQQTQTVKGKVIDTDAQFELPGSNIILVGTDPIIGTTANENGEFIIEGVPVGRYNIQASFMGYQPAVLNNILVTSGKEVQLTFELKELFVELDEIDVSGFSKEKPLNNMATVSARSFSVEETRRYAGGLDDPGRLASVYAGVADGNIESNGIVVRGNAPTGVMYRIEGVEVMNPNHFAGEDLLGGGFVSLLNSYVLTNSDFLTGAFPAEYGNALSAVFDMNLRTGNMDKREYAFQIGVLGIDLSSEGPFVKGKKASYLFNYRYSTFGLIRSFLPDAGLPTYQDLSFKLNFPTKAGTFSFWGVGGYDDYTNNDSEEAVNKETFTNTSIIDDHYNSGILGLNHKLILNHRYYVNSSVLYNVYTKSNDLKRQHTDLNYYQEERLESTEGRIVVSSFLNSKFSARHINKTGINYVNLFYDIDNEVSFQFPDPPERISKVRGNTNLLQAYTASQYNLSKDFLLNIGLHAQYFTLNKSYAIEPRIGLKYFVNPKSSLAIAYGKHSQLQFINAYFIQSVTDEGTELPNKDLDFTKAHHIILSYETQLSKNMRMIIEPFYQYLYDVPVISDSSFSLLNLVDANTFNGKLVNEGTATNIGIDFTLERFFHKGFYFLATASVFNSMYVGGDGIERNTRFNKNFVGNVLGGKEWVFKNKTILGVNARAYLKGGNRMSPIDQMSSAEMRQVVYDENRAFERQEPFGYRCDISLTYTINGKKATNIIAVQVMNVLGSIIYYEDSFDYFTNTVVTKEGTDSLPSISWKIEF